MFGLVNGIYQSYFSTPQLNILVVGAQSSGKTTLMERIKVTDFASKAPAGSGVLSHYSSPLSTRDAKELFFRDGSVHVEQDDAPESPVPAKQTEAFTDLETPDTKRRLMAVSNNQQQRRFPWICPAPKRYQHDQADSDDDHSLADDEQPNGGALRSLPNIPLPLDLGDESSSLLPEHEQSQLTLLATPPSSQNSTIRGSDPPAQTPPRSVSMDENDAGKQRSQSMQSIELSDHRSSALNGETQTDFDLKKNCKMLPLVKIRPTIGMNLCRINNICGAKCHIMDVGGRMQQLWERYYHDCDAVIFVWKMTTKDDVEPFEEDDSDDDDDDDDRPVITAQQQLQMLERVRSSIPEDVPFLVIGQCRSPTPPSQIKTNRMYSSSCLLPNYHNLYQALYFANAATGQGVKAALEWLVPLAKRQQITRVRADVNATKL